MDQFIALLLNTLPIFIIVLGLILCGISGLEFPGENPRDRQYAAITGMCLVLLGIAGLAWKPLVFIYPFLFFGALVCFAIVGLIRALRA
jgi:hypothetical protein